MGYARLDQSILHAATSGGGAPVGGKSEVLAEAFSLARIQDKTLDAHHAAEPARKVDKGDSDSTGAIVKRCGRRPQAALASCSSTTISARASLARCCKPGRATVTPSPPFVSSSSRSRRQFQMNSDIVQETSPFLLVPDRAKRANAVGRYHKTCLWCGGNL